VGRVNVPSVAKRAGRRIGAAARVRKCPPEWRKKVSPVGGVGISVGVGCRGRAGVSRQRVGGLQLLVFKVE